jgi:hypothetical protein
MAEVTMTSPTKNFIFHFFIYYIAWTVCILFAAKNNSLAATAVVVFAVMLQLFWQFKRKDIHGLLGFTLFFTVVGFMVDTGFLHLNIVNFNANPWVVVSPPWLIGIWVCFAIFVFATLKAYCRLYITLGILAFILFPIAYLTGAKFGAAFFPGGYVNSIWIGLVWAFLFPFCMKMNANRMVKHD